MQTWFDRPLSLAGRVIIAGADPMQPETRLLHIRRPLLQIPNLAIHFNREANDGVKLSKQKDMLPILGIITDEMEKGRSATVRTVPTTAQLTAMIWSASNAFPSFLSG